MSELEFKMEVLPIERIQMEKHKPKAEIRTNTVGSCPSCGSPHIRLKRETVSGRSFLCLHCDQPFISPTQHSHYPGEGKSWKF